MDKALAFLLLLFAIPVRAQTQILEGIASSGSSATAVTGGWTWLQDQAMSASAGGNGAGVQACTNSNQHCTITLPATTTAKSDMIIAFESYSSTTVTISSAFSCASLTGGVCNSGNAVDTFTLCTSSGCNIQNSGNDNVDLTYVAQSAGGANFVTINVSADPTTQGFNYYFQEALPPKCNGSTCNSSFDTSTKCSSVSACSSPTMAATDLMLGGFDSAQGVTAHNYSIEPSGNLFGLDLTSSPAFTVTTAGYWTTSQIFFKSTAGSFSPSNTLFSPVNIAPPQGNFTFTTACTTSTCSITPTGTTTNGDGIIIFASGDKTISSVSGRAGTWVVPSGAGTCQNTGLSTIDISCSYTLSNTCTTGSHCSEAITATMSGTCTSCFLGYIEWSRTSGSNVLDAQGSGTSVGTTTLSGQSLTLNGVTPDVCFYQMGWTGSVLADGGVVLYPYPGGAYFLGWYASPQHSTAGMLLNVNGASSIVPKNTLSAAATTSVSMGLCFK